MKPFTPLAALAALALAASVATAAPKTHDPGSGVMGFNDGKALFGDGALMAHEQMLKTPAAILADSTFTITNRPDDGANELAHVPDQGPCTTCHAPTTGNRSAGDLAKAFMSPETASKLAGGAAPSADIRAVGDVEYTGKLMAYQPPGDNSSGITATTFAAHTTFAGIHGPMPDGTPIWAARPPDATFT